METRRNIDIEEELRALIDEVREGVSYGSLTILDFGRAEVSPEPLDNKDEVA